MQGRIPVKWTAPEALTDHVFSFKSDMYVAIIFIIGASLSEPYTNPYYEKIAVLLIYAFHVLIFFCYLSSNNFNVFNVCIRIH